MTPTEAERLSRLEQWKDNTDGWLKTLANQQTKFEERLDERLEKLDVKFEKYIPRSVSNERVLLFSIISISLTIIGFLLKG